MSNMDQAFLKRLFKNWTFVAILGYLIFGMFLNAFRFANLSYFDIFYSVMNSDRFLILFLYPSFILLFTLCFQILNQQTEFLLRLGSRKKVALYHIRLLLISSAILFFYCIIINFIFCNLVSNNGYQFTALNQLNLPNWFCFIYSIIRIYLTILTIGFLNLALTFLIKEKVILITLGFNLLLYITYRISFQNLFFLDWMNPGYHSHGMDFTTNLFYLFGSDFLYFSIFIFFALRFIFRSVKTVHFDLNRK